VKDNAPGGFDAAQTGHANVQKGDIGVTNSGESNGVDSGGCFADDHDVAAGFNKNRRPMRNSALSSAKRSRIGIRSRCLPHQR